jgi:hypothetical protein
MTPSGHHVEKRTGRRFEMHAPVFFTVRTATGASATRSGVTRDVGPGGLFFRTTAGKDLQPDLKVNVRLFVPREGVPSSRSPVALSADARIVRAERLEAAKNGNAGNGGPEAEDRWGIAVQFIGRPTVDLSSLFFAAPMPAGQN